MSGNTDDLKGRVKQAVGDLTNDDDLKREGKADQAGARIKDAAENLKNKVGETVDAVKDKLNHKK